MGYTRIKGDNMKLDRTFFEDKERLDSFCSSISKGRIPQTYSAAFDEKGVQCFEGKTLDDLKNKINSYIEKSCYEDEEDKEEQYKLQLFNEDDDSLIQEEV